jgi:mono/diheme cytochrome c family protein
VKRALLIVLAGAALLLGGLLLLLRVPQATQTVALPATTAMPPHADLAAQIERGAYLARAGDCQACHTVRGAAAYAGGRAIPTPFGTFYSPNITPDAQTGIGLWTADDFWRAMHEGRSRDGSPLYPVFPYTNYTRVTREDSDALFVYLKSLPPVAQARREHELKFPYQYRPLLAGWRLLFFRPGVYEPEPAQNEEWNRGAYLVQGLGHCSACHESRNALGASRAQPAGGLVLNWYAPSLSVARDAGVQDWPVHDIAALLKDGVSPQASALGPMAEVVYESLQHLTDADIRAMAVYLKDLPVADAQTKRERRAPRDLQAIAARGEKTYADHCASCHGDNGEGRAPAAPALAGNRALTMDVMVNPIRVLLYGGYAPGTAGNPRPYGMPPFVHTLSDQEIADVLTYTRNAWGNEASAVSSADVARHRAGPLW